MSNGILPIRAQKNLEKLLATVNEKFPGIPVFFNSLLPRYDWEDNPVKTFNFILSDFLRSIPNVTFLNFWDYFDDEDLYYDKLHLNDDGRQVFADCLRSALRRHLCARHTCLLTMSIKHVPLVHVPKQVKSSKSNQKSNQKSTQKSTPKITQKSSQKSPKSQSKTHRKRHRRPRIRRRHVFQIFAGQGFLQIGFSSTPTQASQIPPRPVHGHGFYMPIFNLCRHARPPEDIYLPTPPSPYIARKILGKIKKQRRRRIQKKRRRKKIPALQG